MLERRSGSPSIDFSDIRVVYNSCSTALLLARLVCLHSTVYMIGFPSYSAIHSTKFTKYYAALFNCIPKVLTTATYQGTRQESRAIRSTNQRLTCILLDQWAKSTRSRALSHQWETGLKTGQVNSFVRII